MRWFNDYLRSLKLGSCHDANFVVIGGTIVGRYDNLWDHQWWQSWPLGFPCLLWAAHKVTHQARWRTYHDDVIKWKHFPRYWSFVRGIHRSPVNSPHKGQWRGALMFSLICVWINGWVNNREAGDLRRYLAHYDVIVMCVSKLGHHWFRKKSAACLVPSHYKNYSSRTVSQTRNKLRWKLNRNIGLNIFNQEIY